MTTFTFTDFRKNASAVLDRVERGESVCVVRHGKAIARIIPAKPDRREPAWKQPGPRLVIPGTSLSKVLLEERRSAR
jgi:prevent-host-death family protein